VIVITTKRGASGAPQIGYTGSYSISNVNHGIDLLDTQEFINFQNQNGTPSNIYENGNTKTDWMDQIMRTAMTHNQTINFSGGSENTNYYASFNVLNQEGVIKNSKMKKYTGRINIDQKFLGDRLNVKLNL